jgi:hypothetical protein
MTSTQKLRQLFISRDKADKRPLDEQLSEEAERLSKTFLIAAQTNDKNYLIFLGWDK